MLEYSIDIAPGIAAGVAADYTLMPEVVRPVQTHSCNVGLIGRDGTLPDLNDTDAIISLCKGMKIGVRTADCVPVVIYAPDIEACAAIHAGWKGTLGHIVEATTARLAQLGADLHKARAAFGPGICGGCYEISEALTAEFHKAGFSDCVVAPRHIDLAAANRKQLLSAGIPHPAIQMCPYCTFESEAFPSWRRKPTDQRLLTWIGLLD